MTERTVIESALLSHTPDGWDEHDIGIMADDLEDILDDLDRDGLAHRLWAMGAVAEHEGCRYADGCDADYENECGPCEDYLRSVAERVLSTLRFTHASGDREQSNG